MGKRSEFRDKTKRGKKIDIKKLSTFFLGEIVKLCSNLGWEN